MSMRARLFFYRIGSRTSQSYDQRWLNNERRECSRSRSYMTSHFLSSVRGCSLISLAVPSTLCRTLVAFEFDIWRRRFPAWQGIWYAQDRAMVLVHAKLGKVVLDEVKLEQAKMSYKWCNNGNTFSQVPVNFTSATSIYPWRH